MKDRKIKYDFYGEFVVMMKVDNFDVPVAIFIDEDDAKEYIKQFPNIFYMMTVKQIIKLQNLMERNKEN